MPTYQYVCTACAEPLEAVQSFSDAPLSECPACAGRLRKVFSAVGVVFKGSGFYKTDSRTAGKSATPAAASSGSSDSSTPSTSSAPSTPSTSGTPGTSAPASTPTSSPSPSSGSTGPVRKTA